VFDPQGQLFMVTGSPGGSLIINYVAKTLVGVIDWKLDIQQAIALPNRGSRNRATEIEKGSVLESLSQALGAMGHEVQAIEMTSGLQGIVRTPAGLVGGADPRREGLVLAD
jgi:gamma-glutamyltranspeptidase/glutathione hydrolase